MSGDDPNVALLANAATVRPLATPGADEPDLPLRRVGRLAGTQNSVVCAAYLATCIGATFPPRASLSLASGEGGLGLGIPARRGQWQLRATDFCKGPPPELARPGANFAELASKRDESGAAPVPAPADCFCPTDSLAQRFKDPLGYGRQMPLGANPKLPRLPASTRCAAGRSFITYQCSRFLLLPPPQPRPYTARAAGVNVLLATSDHFGHGLFAMVQRVLNQVHLARREGLEPAVFLGERTFMEPQVRRGHMACT